MYALPKFVLKTVTTNQELCKLYPLYCESKRIAADIRSFPWTKSVRKFQDDSWLRCSSNALMEAAEGSECLVRGKANSPREPQLDHYQFRISNLAFRLNIREACVIESLVQFSEMELVCWFCQQNYDSVKTHR